MSLFPAWRGHSVTVCCSISEFADESNDYRCAQGQMEELRQSSLLTQISLTRCARTRIDQGIAGRASKHSPVSHKPSLPIPSPDGGRE